MTTIINILEDIQSRKQIDLSQPMVKGMPIHPAHPPYHITLNNRHGDVIRPCGHSSSNEMMVLSTHAGTHIDALCHVSEDGKLFGGHDASEEQQGTQLFKNLGAENLKPTFTRGILLDVAAYKAVDALDPAYEITEEDLVNTARAQGSEIREGDVVLIRTGWGKFWDDASKYLGGEEGAPGPGVKAGEWLAQWKPSAVGSDTSAFEVMNHHNITLEVHMILIARNGINIIENLLLEELSETKQYEFLFISLPIKIVGATGSPIRPIALI
ncbi:cyclase family protein [Bacillus sp. Marseille-P3661]|uniref:cyclase family protein n=1 Tax=Bacillus sp. Marseille-P3661 TaxID=1936234 RepID=UPI000C8533FD|nr:cyclase family protein [Bacillus sp. Marseille-P3661]